jgi:alginate O-acetyltransferase complex protein AlgI
VRLAEALPILQLVLPVGISFYTFHTISYIVDVTVGRVRPTRNIVEYLAYVGLFFQLVAGPIVRFRQINTDLQSIDHPMREDDVATGIGFFVVGLVKKVIVADQIARYIDPMLATYGELSTAGAWAAAIGYAMQLYFDFSGYSDMAVGLGRMFGVRIPQNIDGPYRAVGIGDFWRRWHISLSSWLRDYLYIPLGGNRQGTVRLHVNLMITMVLGGLWHGANWTFVIWGAYHGVLLVLDRQLQPLLVRLPEWTYRLLTFLLVVVGWVFFRSTDLPMALAWLGKLCGTRSGETGPSVALLGWLGLAALIVVKVPETWHLNFGSRPRWALVYALVFCFAYLFMNGREQVFLYYQF